jgi:hypothetical protein
MVTETREARIWNGRGERARRERGGVVMSIAGNIERFPPRRSAVVWLLREYDDEWLVIGGANGWSHGDYPSALADAQWLAENLELPIRVLT